MQAAYYERNGSAREVLQVGDVPTPRPGPGEVRVKLADSGVNPSDVKSRQGSTRKIAFPRVIPHSDGAGVIDEVGDGVPKSRIGERVWIWNGQWKRAFGTAAEFIVLPAAQAVTLPGNVSFRCRCLPWNPGDDGCSRRCPRQCRQRYDPYWYLAAPERSANTSFSSQKLKVRRSSPRCPRPRRPKPRTRRAPTTPSTTSVRMSASGSWRSPPSAASTRLIEMDLSANANLIPQVLRAKGSVIVYGTGPEAVLPAAFLPGQFYPSAILPGL